MQGLTIRDPSWRRWAILAIVGALAAAWWWIIPDVTGGMGWVSLMPLLGFVVLGLFGILSSLFLETGINGVTNRVTRYWSFLGIVPLWSSRSRLEEYSAVTVSPTVDSGTTLWYVQLSRTSKGRPCYLTSLYRQSEAQSVAASIAEETGLPVIEEGVDGQRS